MNRIHKYAIISKMSFEKNPMQLRNPIVIKLLRSAYSDLNF